MLLKRYFLIGLISFLMIGLGGCFDSANQNQTIVANLIQDIPDTFEGKYLVRFDKGGGEYYKLDADKEGLLLLDSSTKIPQTDKNKLLVQVLDNQVNLESNIVSNPFFDTKSDVYAIKVKLKIEATKEAINKSFDSNVKFIFPAIPQVRDRLGAKEPSSMPEISFSIKHHTKYSAYGLGKLFPDITFIFNNILIIVLAVGYFVINVISEFYSNYKKAIRSRTWWLSAIVFFPLAFWILFPTLRNIFWIISGLWGG